MTIGVCGLVAAGTRLSHSTAQSTVQVPVPRVSDQVFSSTTDRQTTRTKMGCTPGSQPTNFAAYSLGRSFNGLPLMAILRRCDLPQASQPTRANYLSYIYGDCVSGSDQGCQPPLEVQTWPACERSLASYASNEIPSLDPPANDSAARVAVFDGGNRTEVYTDRSTVVIFGTDPGEVKAAAASLIPNPPNLAPNTAVASSGQAPSSLPAPAPGSLTGTLSCIS